MKQNRIFHQFFKYVSLNVLGMIGLSCYILADTFFISKSLGAAGLTALNFSIPVYCVINATGLMAGIGGATRCALIRSGEGKNADAVFTQTLCLALGAGLAFAAAGLFLARPIAVLMGADSTSLELTCDYLRTILLFSPFFILNNVLIAFARNDNAPKRAMTAMLTGSFSNILLDYIFMFPLSMGMFGAALATCVAPILSILILLPHFIGKQPHLRVVKFKPSLKAIPAILSPGLSAFITEISAGAVMTAFNLMILRLAGSVGVAAYGVVINAALVCTSVFTGIAQGIQPLISRTYAEQKTGALRKTLFYALTVSVLFSAAVYAFVFLRTDTVIMLFNSEGNEQLRLIALRGFRIYFAGFFFAGINTLIASFLSACDRAAGGLTINMLRGFLLILPLALLFASFWGMDGIWLSFLASEAAAAVLSAILYKKYNRPAERFSTPEAAQ